MGGRVKHKVWHKHIARGQPEHRRQLGQGAGNAASGFQRMAKIVLLVRIAQLQRAAAPSGIQVLRNVCAQPGGIDQYLRHAIAQQRGDVPIQQRSALHGQQGFGGVVGQRAHALTAAGGQQHGRRRGKRRSHTSKEQSNGYGKSRECSGCPVSSLTTPKNVFTISSWVCGRDFGRSASLQILAIAKLLLWFAPRNPSRTASPTPSFEIMNTFLGKKGLENVFAISREHVLSADVSDGWAAIKRSAPRHRHRRVGPGQRLALRAFAPASVAPCP